MASVATGNILHRAHLVLLLQSVTQRLLVGVGLPVDNYRLSLGGLLIAHVEHLLARTQILFRVAMAVEAEFHLQRRVLIHQGHLVNWTVAVVASHSFIDVDAVVEIYVVRHLVHASPLQGTAAAEAFADRFEIGGVGPDLSVAVDAGLCRRDSGEARSLHRGMTITAIYAQSSDVMLMAEWNRLRLPNAGVGDVWSSFQLKQHP